MSSGEEVILTVTVITPIWDNDLQKTIPAGYSGTVTISVEKKDSGTATVSTMIDRTNVSLTIQHAAETEYTDGDIDAIIADGGFKKGLLYTIGSSVYFCYNSLTDPDTIRYNRQSGLLLLPEFSYSEGSLVYSGTPIDGSNPPFSAGRGYIVKQDGKYYIVCSTTWYYNNVNLDEETDAFYRII